jgi:hypothetical protein
MILQNLHSNDVLEDALQIVAAYHHLTEQHAFVLRLQFLSLERNTASQMELLFEKMPHQICSAVLREYLTWILSTIEETVDNISISGKSCRLFFFV